MYLAIAYGLGAFIAVIALVLLWIGWQHRRDEARLGLSVQPKLLRGIPNRDSPRKPSSAVLRDNEFSTIAVLPCFRREAEKDGPIDLVASSG